MVNIERGTASKVVLKGNFKGFWGKQELSQLDYAGKLLAVYCLSGPHTQGPGLFVMFPGQVQKALGMSAEDFEFYLELVVSELGWRWDAKQNLLWIPDYFRWAEVTTQRQLHQMLDALSLLPEHPWIAELCSQPPAELSPALQQLWIARLMPQLQPASESTAETKSKKSTHQVDSLARLTVEQIPQVVERYVHRRAPVYFQQEVELFLHYRVDYLHRYLSAAAAGAGLPLPNAVVEGVSFETTSTSGGSVSPSPN